MHQKTIQEDWLQKWNACIGYICRYVCNTTHAGQVATIAGAAGGTVKELEQATAMELHHTCLTGSAYLRTCMHSISQLCNYASLINHTLVSAACTMPPRSTIKMASMRHMKVSLPGEIKLLRGNAQTEFQATWRSPSTTATMETTCMLLQIAPVLATRLQETQACPMRPRCMLWTRNPGYSTYARADTAIERI